MHPPSALQVSNCGPLPTQTRAAECSGFHQRRRIRWQEAHRDDPQAHHLHGEDAIIWYTDGITENENAEHEPYGDRRFRRVINRAAFLSAEQARDAIMEDVIDYYGGYPLKDDVTLVVGRVG
jgi:Stage II sporulation protein E (SpoIIE)